MKPFYYYAFSVPGGLGELARAVELLGAKPIRAGSNLTFAELSEIMRLERRFHI